MLVPSVERIHLPRSRTRSAKTDDAAAREHHPVSAHVYLGGWSAASVQWRRRSWSWNWAIGSDGDANGLHPTELISVFFTWSSSGSRNVLPPPLSSRNEFIEYGVDGNSAGSSRLPETRPDRSPPFQGLVAIYNAKARFGRLSVCWAGGPRGESLYLASFLPSSNAPALGQRQTLLSLPTKESEHFEEPIVQVVSSPIVSTERLSRRATALLVRLQRKTYYLHALPNPSFVPPSDTPAVSLLRLGCLNPEDTEMREHVDSALDPSSWGRAVVVDDGGGVWLWWETTEYVDHQTKAVLKLSKLRSATEGEVAGYGFYRVAFGSRPDTVLVMSRTTLEVIDIRQPSETHILHSTSGDIYFTALDKSACSRSSGVICAVTNREVLWIDDSERYKPIFRWSHDMAGGVAKELEIRTASIQPDSKGAPSLVVLVRDPADRSIVAVRIPDHGPVNFLSQPWSMTDLTALSRSATALAVLPPQYSGNTNCLQLCAMDTQDIPVGHLSQAPESVASAETDVEIKREDVYQGRWAWIAVNDFQAAPLLETDEFIRELRTVDAPLGHFTTISELARDCAFQSASTNRSNLLRPLRFPTGQSSAAVDKAISATQFPYVGHVGNPHYLNLGQHRITSNTAADRQVLAASCLSDDLAFSSHAVYSDTWDTGGVAKKPAGNDESVEDMFAAAARNLSLYENIPADQFKYLRFKKDGVDEGSGSAVSALPFVRHLLGEWTSGERPEQYQWSRPRTSSPSSPAYVTPRPIRPLPRQVHDLPTKLLERQFERPIVPPPYARSSPPRLPSRASSPLRMDGFSGSDIESPAKVLQTQQERGPHGARPDGRVAKKKIAKRRQGGF